MAKRLLPTGSCWCGCKTQVDVGSFFAPGHDKKAEARLIMEVFGGVPQFLEAFGYGPGGNENAASDSWAFWAMKLAGIQRRESTTRFKIEYADLADPKGPLKRSPEGALTGEVDITDGAAFFRIEPSTFAIPFIDIAGVYKAGAAQIVRVAGAMKPYETQFGGAWEYVARGQGDHVGGVAMSSAFSEFKARLKKTHAEVTLTVLEGTERRVYTGHLAYNIGTDDDGMVFMVTKVQGEVSATLVPIPKGIVTGWTEETAGRDYFRRFLSLGYVDGNTSAFR